MIVDPVLTEPLRELLIELEECERLNHPLTHNGGSEISAGGFESTLGNERQQCPDLITTAALFLTNARIATRCARDNTIPHNALTQAEKQARKEDRERLQRIQEEAKRIADEEVERLEHIAPAPKRKVSISVTEGHLTAKWGNIAEPS